MIAVGASTSRCRARRNRGDSARNAVEMFDRLWDDQTQHIWTYSHSIARKAQSDRDLSIKYKFLKSNRVYVIRGPKFSSGPKYEKFPDIWCK